MGLFGYLALRLVTAKTFGMCVVFSELLCSEQSIAPLFKAGNMSLVSWEGVLVTGVLRWLGVWVGEEVFSVLLYALCFFGVFVWLE